MGPDGDDGGFRSLFEQKEKELVSICVRQIEFFHQQVLERDRHFAELSMKFSQLKDDFKYNLELLDGRDAELLNYETELASLQLSVKAARAQQKEIQDRLTQAESEKLEEKTRSGDKDKVYQQTLMTLRQQIEGLQFTREQLFSMHKEAFETATAELMSEVERRKADLENHSKALETQYHDKLRIHELQSKLVLDAMENKLSKSERQVNQLENELDMELAKRRDDANTEKELRAEVLVKDRIIKRLSEELDGLRADNDDLLSRAEGADLRTKQVNMTLQDVEAEHRKQSLQMRLQVEDLQKRLEITESRLGEWEGKRPGEITGYLQKVAHLEQVMVTEDSQLKLKLEGVETYIRESMQHQDQKVQELKFQAVNWKAEHDYLLAKFRALQKEGIGGQSGKHLINEGKPSHNRAENMGSNHDLSTIGYDLQTGSHLLTGISLPLPGERKCVGGSTHSLGSSLPQASPLLSPAFSSPEESMKHFLPEDDRGGKENEKLASVEEENRCLRGSVQNLKEQNERIRAVVGTMREEMEALQNTTMQGAPITNTVAPGPGKGDVWSNDVETVTCTKRGRVTCLGRIPKIFQSIQIEEMKKIRDEVNTLMGQIVCTTSQLQQVQQMKPNCLVDQQAPLEPQQASLEENDKNLNSRSFAYDSKEAAAKIAELERVQHVLRTQLERAAHDVMRMAEERDLLMEISNSLHADFNRSLQQETVKQSAPTTQTATPSPESRGHERQRKIAITGPLCSGTGTQRPSTSPSKSSSRSSGQERAAPPKQVCISKYDTVRRFRRDPDTYTYKDSLYTTEETEQEREERRLLLEGRMTPLQERPDLQQDFVHKGTPSQRTKLQASIKRREAQMANRSKVRNYNIKDTVTHNEN